MIDLSREDSQCLDVSDEQAVEVFSVSIGVTRQEVLEAVSLIGAMPNALRAYFASQNRIKAWPAVARRVRSEASAAGRKRRREAPA